MTHPQFVTYGQIVTTAIVAEARFDGRKRAWKRALAWYRSLRTKFVTSSGPITRCGSQPALLGLAARGLTAGWRWWGKIGGDGHPNRLNRSS